MGDLTKNFSRWEFACKGINCCGGSAPVDLALVEGLQELRDKLNTPINIISGFRCLTHNKRENGSRYSQHTLAKAVDIKIPDGIEIDKLIETIETIDVFREGGVGIYSTRIHLDVRKYKTRWGS